MAFCLQCGTAVRNRNKYCDPCRQQRKHAKYYKSPHVKVTDQERKGFESLRLVYNPGYAIDAYFKEVYDSL